MRLDAIARPLGGAFAARFFVVATVPTAAAALFLLVLVWAGAPGPVRFSRAWETAAALGTGEALLLVLGITLAGMVTFPLQLPLLRLLEGYWPSRPQWLFGPIVRLGIAVQKWRCGRVEDSAPSDQAALQVAGAALGRQRSRYPREALMRPTALGNALTATEQTAGRLYKLDPVVIWPRLEPLLSPAVRDACADRRLWLDAAARLATTAGLSAPIAMVLLWESGWSWRLLSLVPLLLSWLAYTAAVQAAVAFGECVTAAIDLHRFDLLKALHLPLPADRQVEREQNEKLCRLLRQGGTPPHELPYTHPQESSVPP